MNTEVTAEDNIIVVALQRLINQQDQRYERAYVRLGQSHSDAKAKTLNRQLRESHALLVKARNALAEIEAGDSVANDEGLATIAWKAESESWGHLQDTLLNMIGYTVTVVPVVGEPYDATIYDVETSHPDGELRITFHAWDDEKAEPDPERVTRLNVWTELQRIEVF